jgi:hypothetical protein
VTARLALRGTVAAACLALMAAARAETATSASGFNVPRSATARLDFSLSIQKFLFFGVGASPWPAQSNAVGTVRFVLAPSIPPAGIAPVAGSRQPVDWPGGAPVFAVTASDHVLPVEVRSNAGPIAIRAEASTPLSNGSHTIPMSEITIASSNPGLPAPPVPASGIGGAALVAGTGFSSLVTLQKASWTFGYANSASRSAGSYTGVLRFTASTP